LRAVEFASVGEVVDDVMTWSPERDAPSETFVYIDLSAVDQASKSIVDARNMPCSEAPSRARQLVAAGDVLVSTVRPNLNGVALVPPVMHGATASTGFCVLRARPEELDSAYLFHWVRSPRFVDAMVRMATGASYPAISDRIVFESKLPMFPIAVQHRISRILNMADSLRSKRRAALAQFDVLAQSIFLEMFGDPVLNTKSWPATVSLGEVASITSGITKGRKLVEKTTRMVPYLAVSNV
jgi:type I restriction enzyme S subunit